MPASSLKIGASYPATTSTRSRFSIAGSACVAACRFSLKPSWARQSPSKWNHLVLLTALKLKSRTGEHFAGQCFILICKQPRTVTPKKFTSHSSMYGLITFKSTIPYLLFSSSLSSRRCTNFCQGSSRPTPSCLRLKLPTLLKTKFQDLDIPLPINSVSYLLASSLKMMHSFQL